MNIKLLLFIPGAIFTASSALAANQYTSIESCGSAKIISGDDCSNAVVEFDFTGCKLKLSPQTAKKIVCKDSQLKARIEKDDFRYEAVFFRDKESNWGSGGTWKFNGSLRQLTKSNSVTTAVASTQEIRTVAESTGTATPPLVAKVEPPQLTPPSTTASSSNSASSPSEPAPAGKAASFKFSGYVDLRYSNFTSEDNHSAPNPYAESGFGVEDGAIYLNYENNRVAFVGDLAFRRAKDIDTNPSAVPNQSSNGNLAFGIDKSQAYLRYNLSPGLYVNFGQFDTMFGVELNDSKDRVFGKTGLVYDQTLPVTHTGALIEYGQNGFTGKLFAANPNNKGTNGTSAAGDENSEYGTALSFSNETYRSQVGYMARPIKKADGTEMSTRSLVDITAGATFGNISVDAEYSVVTDPSKNTLTASDNTDSENAGTGLLILPSFRASDSVLLGLRYEHIQDDPAALALKSGNAYGLSVHYRVSTDLELRAEYNSYLFKDTSDVSWSDSRSNIAALLNF